MTSERLCQSQGFKQSPSIYRSTKVDAWPRSAPRQLPGIIMNHRGSHAATLWNASQPLPVRDQMRQKKKAALMMNLWLRC